MTWVRAAVKRFGYKDGKKWNQKKKKKSYFQQNTVTEDAGNSVATRNQWRNADILQEGPSHGTGWVMDPPGFCSFTCSSGGAAVLTQAFLLLIKSRLWQESQGLLTLHCLYPHQSWWTPFSVLSAQTLAKLTGGAFLSGLGVSTEFPHPWAASTEREQMAEGIGNMEMKLFQVSEFI